MSSEIFNCELNTVLEKFFEAPEPPQPEKEGAEKSGTEEGEEEEEKDDKENMKKIASREPLNLGANDFRPPFEDDEEEEESTESGKSEEAAKGEAEKE